MVVIDTNVIYAALRSNLGSSYVILAAMAEGQVDYAVSAAIVFEYEDVLKRPKSQLVFTEPEIDQILDSIVALGNRHSSHFLWRPFLKDPKDDMILELAVVSASDRIITHNIKDFKGSSKLGVEAITPLEYLKKEKLL
jgi:putative PIN family toxin of toxin-antitoxin system